MEADSPNSPWTPIPVDDVKFEVLDLDLVRMENPALDEIVPVDHRTPLGNLGGGQELLGFGRLAIVRERLGQQCKLRDVRNWLRCRGIDPRGINWTDFIDLLQNEHPVGEAKPQPDTAHSERQGEWSRPLSKEVMATALGLLSAYKLTVLAERGVYKVRPAGNRQTWQICLSGLPEEARKKLA
jgi:hypothetical protein